MTLNEIRDQAITPALALLPALMAEKRAQVDQLMLTAHLQEAPNREQCQLPIRPGKCGPARGIWQFERGGGVAGVLRHKSSRDAAIAACRALGIEPTVDGVFAALPGQVDVIDAVFARLLFWTDPLPLPELGDVEGAWQYYLRNWRPGAYERGTPPERRKLRQKWGANYARVLETLQVAA
ncbi:hypothetical protein EGJ86_07180 [Pseudomonas sp. o96-267]|uniref:hypothetical protein n=1 Tax=Pseudomonas sp. o96-267 TaxID=2479853 RepID=UPI000F791776|nr:hypothetical protein [Pseudomonas sp. o96-267]RRV41262.1 hypothetical protein EGJ86_07180 [Pseudomonas sp. o96-267]